MKAYVGETGLASTDSAVGVGAASTVYTSLLLLFHYCQFFSTDGSATTFYYCYSLFLVLLLFLLLSRLLFLQLMDQLWGSSRSIKIEVSTQNYLGWHDDGCGDDDGGGVHNDDDYEFEV